MNIYEDEQLEQKLGEVSDQLGYLLLDFLAASIKKISVENLVHNEFEECRKKTNNDNRF